MDRSRTWRVRAFRLAGGLLLWAAGLAAAENWPQLQYGPSRSGHTPEEPAAGYHAAWVRSLGPTERVHNLVQVISVDGRAFVGTKRGVMHALDVRTGQDLWTFTAGGPIMHTAACAGGKLFFGCLDGNVYALDAAAGKLLWTFQGAEGFSTAPLVAEDKLYIGDRGGLFHALSQADGKELWHYDADDPIQLSAAFDNGVVFFGSDAVRVFALEAATGKPLWASEPLWGTGLRDYWPVIHQGKVIVRTAPSWSAGNWCFDVSKEFGELAAARKPLLDAAGVKPEERDRDYLDLTKPADAGKMNNIFIPWLQRHPQFQTMYALDAATGKQPYACGVGYSVVNGGCAVPPVVGDGGKLYVLFSRQNWQGWAAMGDGAVGEFDLATGRVMRSLMANQGYIGELTSDETNNFISAGPALIGTRSGGGTVGGYNFRTNESIQLRPAQTTKTADGYELFPPYPLFPFTDDGCTPGNAPVVANGRIFLNRWHHICCWQAAEQKEGTR